jgi:hypothetical protein
MFHGTIEEAGKIWMGAVGLWHCLEFWRYEGKFDTHIDDMGYIEGIKGYWGDVHVEAGYPAYCF